VIAKTSDNVVHNINFPYPTTAETTKEMTTLSNIMHGKDANYPVYCALYEKRGDEYYFAIEQDLSISPPPGSDIYVLLQGKISHSIIDLRRLCS
jgi:broad specificity polyphosphatase/5'/3'-nucleotidase SurE